MTKRFGGINMTWPRVILGAAAAGVVTARAAMYVPEGNSFREIAVSLEAWVLFAILILVNCEKPLEAAVKTFVFFLISQPLVYLLQVPFSRMGWGLFGYYRYWFILTLLTLPGAFLGWYIKKDTVWSGAILSVMLFLLAWLGVSYARDAVKHFPNHVISALFCFGQIGLYFFGILKSKRSRLAAGALTALALIGYGLYARFSPANELVTVVDLDETRYPISENCTLEPEDNAISSAELVDMGGGDYYVRLHVRAARDSGLILRDETGAAYRIAVVWGEQGAELREPEGETP